MIAGRCVIGAFALGACDAGTATDETVTAAIAPPPNRCEITLTACPAHPMSPLTPFLDDHDGSSTNPDRCLARAEEYRQWCGASRTQSVRARAFLREAVVGTEIAPPTRCEITLDACPNHPSASLRPFLDDYDGSGSDPARCLRRANEYQSWCGNSTTQAVMARAFRGGYFLASARSPQALCEITLTACPAHPTTPLGPFLDDHDGSGADAARCLDRAEDYRVWCGATVTQPVTARAFAKGSLVDSRTAGRSFGFTEHLFDNDVVQYDPPTKLTAANFDRYLSTTEGWTQWVRTSVVSWEVLQGSRITHKGGYIKLDNYWSASLGRSQLVPDVPPSGRSSISVDHLHFRQAEWIGYASDTAGPGKSEIWSCSYSSAEQTSYFVSKSLAECQCSNCKVEGSAGFVWANDGSDRLPFFRCYDRTSHAHFVSLDPSCGGHTQEFRLGYIYHPAAPIPLDLSQLITETSVRALQHLRASLVHAHAQGRQVYAVASPTSELLKNLNFRDFLWVTRRYFQALLEQIGDQIDVWQVLNEADWTHYRDGRGMWSGNFLPPVLGVDYLSEIQAILRITGGMIKNANRRAMVTTNTAVFPQDPATAENAEVRLITYLNAINAHVDVITNDIYPSDFSKQWVPDYLANFRRWYKKPVWIAETGWSSYNHSEEDKARRLDDLLDNSFLNSVASTIIVYNFNDMDFSSAKINPHELHFGVSPWQPDGTCPLGPAGVAVRSTLQSWVANHPRWND